jgi:hypothetical protein
MEREALRAQTTELLQRLRNTDVPQVLFELLAVLCSRLDRIELGAFLDQDETPTKPERRVSSEQVAAVKPLGERTKDIFADAKGTRDPRSE